MALRETIQTLCILGLVHGLVGCVSNPVRRDPSPPTPAGVERQVSDVELQHAVERWAHVWESEDSLLKRYLMAPAVVWGTRDISGGEHHLWVTEVWKSSPGSPKVGDRVRIGPKPPRSDVVPDIEELTFLYRTPLGDWRSQVTRYFQDGLLRSHPQFTRQSLQRFLETHCEDQRWLPAMLRMNPVIPRPEHINLAEDTDLATFRIILSEEGKMITATVVRTVDANWSEVLRRNLSRVPFLPATRGSTRFGSTVEMTFRFDAESKRVVHSIRHLDP